MSFLTRANRSRLTNSIGEQVFIRRIYLQNDQQCSLFLQQRVKTTSPERKRRLLEAVGDHLIELSTSKFGNSLLYHARAT